MAELLKVQLQRIAEKIGGQVETVVKKVVTDLGTKVIERTPVDTGRARANWNAALNVVDTAVTESLDKTGKGAGQKVANALGQFKVGDKVTITNSLPYAQVLEYGQYPNPPKNPKRTKTVGGFSRQAPAGMVRVTVTEFNDAVEKAINETR